ncbi:MAG: hypothetical protein ABI759_09175 [Candidatus Solibacter sp.]
MSDLENVKLWLDFLATSRFYGSFTLSWENGHIVHTRQETSRKPADLTPPSEQLKETHGNSSYTRR